MVHSAICRPIVLAALGLACACAPAWPQGQAVGDPTIERFVSFFKRVTVGPVLLKAKIASLQWESPDESSRGEARIYLLSPDRPGTPPRDACGPAVPITIENGRHGVSLPLRAGHMVMWLHDDWRVEVSVSQATETLEADARQVADRLERALSGAKATPGQPVADGAPPTSAATGTSTAAAAGTAAPDRISLSREVGGGPPQPVGDAFDRADAVSAAIMVAGANANDQLAVVWKWSGQTLMQYPLPLTPGLNVITVRLDMTEAGGFQPGAYEVQLLKGQAVWATKTFVVGTPPDPR